jgi:hypothetical protein
MLVLDRIPERGVPIDEDPRVLIRIIPPAVPDIERKVEPVFCPERGRAIFGQELFPGPETEAGHVLANEIAVVTAERLGGSESIGTR